MPFYFHFSAYFVPVEQAVPLFSLKVPHLWHALSDRCSLVSQALLVRIRPHSTPTLVHNSAILSNLLSCFETNYFNQINGFPVGTRFCSSRYADASHSLPSACFFSLFISPVPAFLSASSIYLLLQLYALLIGLRWRLGVRSSYRRTFVPSWMLSQSSSAALCASCWASWNWKVQSTDCSAVRILLCSS